LIVRPAQDADVGAVAEIYGHHVLHSLGTFEEVPPDEAEIARRLRSARALDLAYLVAEDDAGRIAGFAYASPFRTRPAYRFTCEDSVYVHPQRIGGGFGKALLSGLLARCEAQGLRQVVAVIGDSANAASIGLHRSLGFADCGTGRAFGFKFGRWVDVVWMQKELGGGPPTGPGLAL
jgi:L-amino acid N-acyltransferase YncA